jgi:hypothetical protein
MLVIATCSIALKVALSITEWATCSIALKVALRMGEESQIDNV